MHPPAIELWSSSPLSNKLLYTALNGIHNMKKGKQTK